MSTKYRTYKSIYELSSKLYHQTYWNFLWTLRQIAYEALWNEFQKGVNSFQ